MMLSRRTLLQSVAALGVAGFTLGTVGCSPGEGVDLGEGGEGGGAAGAVLTAAIAGEPDQLDPHKTTAYFSFQVLENVFDTLVEPDEDLEMQPALAESWETSDDELTWTFTLREGVTWHDGSEFTSEDVVYSLRRIIDEELANSYRLTAVASIEAPDPRTVVITVSQPSANLLASLGGYKGMAIVNRANVESGEITRAPIGTGPFKVQNYAAGESIALEANPEFWGGAPDLGGVTFRFISEGNTAQTALTNGEIHWTDSFEPQQLQPLEANASVTVGNVPSSDYWYITMNQASEPWSTLEARQAIAYAIDRSAIVQAVSFGTAVENQLAIPQESTWFVEHTPFSTDLDRARQLLSEAGVEGGPVRFMATGEYPETVAVGQILADVLEPLGFDVRIETVDFATWLDRQSAGEWDMLMLGWLGNIDPNDFYYNQHHSTGANNHQGYANPRVDQLLDEGAGETDQERRKEIYGEAARLIADECSYIYLYNPAVLQAWRNDVSGYETRTDAAIRFREAGLQG
ncbi:MAG TPA: ABC transporter substrate-binding protein [Propionibacterium sp.]|nr:ABC transporter substrate-binding protein [Propionibacterium sp.]